MLILVAELHGTLQHFHQDAVPETQEVNLTHAGPGNNNIILFIDISKYAVPAVLLLVILLLFIFSLFYLFLLPNLFYFFIILVLLLVIMRTTSKHYQYTVPAKNERALLIGAQVSLPPNLTRCLPVRVRRAQETLITRPSDQPNIIMEVRRGIIFD